MNFGTEEAIWNEMTDQEKWGMVQEMKADLSDWENDCNQDQQYIQKLIEEQKKLKGVLEHIASPLTLVCCLQDVGGLFNLARHYEDLAQKALK